MFVLNKAPADADAFLCELCTFILKTYLSRLATAASDAALKKPTEPPLIGT